MEITYLHSCQMIVISIIAISRMIYCIITCVLTVTGSDSARGARNSCMKVKVLERFSVVQRVAYEIACKLIVLTQTARVYLFILEFRL